MGRLTIDIENEWCVNGVGYTCCEEYCEERLNECEDCLIYDAISKLAHYEDMEEQGRLITLPCAVGDTVWTYWIDDEESGVMADVPMSERECVVIRSLWGKDYFATREEAVRKLEELKGE